MAKFIHVLDTTDKKYIGRQVELPPGVTEWTDLTPALVKEITQGRIIPDTIQRLEDGTLQFKSSNYTAITTDLVDQ